MDVDKTLIEISKRKELYTHYLHNSDKNFVLGNIAKSSEFLWGAIHTLIYAIALTYDKKLSKHSQIRDFAKELTEIEKDEEIVKGVILGETLHSNFYHNFLDKEQLTTNKKLAEELIFKLENILTKRILDLKQNLESEELAQ